MKCKYLIKGGMQDTSYIFMIKSTETKKQIKTVTRINVLKVYNFQGSMVRVQPVDQIQEHIVPIEDVIVEPKVHISNKLTWDQSLMLHFSSSSSPSRLAQGHFLTDDIIAKGRSLQMMFGPHWCDVTLKFQLSQHKIRGL